MLKTYAGEKISLIMVKITVDFIIPLVFTTVFSFWIRLWWCQILTLFDFRQLALRLPGFYCLWLSPSVVNLVILHLAVRLKPQRAGKTPSWCLGCCFSSGCCYSEGSGLPEQDGCCSMGEDSTLGSWCPLLQFSLQSSCLQSLLRRLQHTMPSPLPEPWVSGCKWKFCVGP